MKQKRRIIKRMQKVGENQMRCGPRGAVLVWAHPDGDGVVAGGVGVEIFDAESEIGFEYFIVQY